jgi:hypothetical protein
MAGPRGHGPVPAPWCLRSALIQPPPNLPMSTAQLRIEPDDLLHRLQTLGRIGDTGNGGCCRLALSDADRAGRDLVCGWMRELGLRMQVDPVGNIFGWRDGLEDLPPVMTGSHIDTVATGGRYDGNYGVLAGLTVVRALNAARHHHAPPAGGGGVHQRRRRALPARHAGVAGLRRRPEPGRCARHTRHRWCRARRRTATHRLPGHGPAAAGAATGFCRTAHRARPGAGCRRRPDRGRAQRARHLVAGAEPSPASPTTPAPRRCGCATTRALRGRHRLLRAPPGRRDGRQPGGHRGRADPAPQPDQRHRGARRTHGGPAQHRRDPAAASRAAAGRPSSANWPPPKACASRPGRWRVLRR